jgi:hypothetical protein
MPYLLRSRSSPTGGLAKCVTVVDERQARLIRRERLLEQDDALARERAVFLLSEHRDALRAEDEEADGRRRDQGRRHV